jgi:hypothetical protein
MAAPRMLQLAQELEWLGCELEWQGKKHALEGFPQAGPSWESFVQKQRGVLVTASKVERELKGAVTYDPGSLVGVDYPLEATLDAVGAQIEALEDIKHCAAYAVHELPAKVRAFTRLVENYLAATGALKT